MVGVLQYLTMTYSNITFGFIMNATYTFHLRAFKTFFSIGKLQLIMDFSFKVDSKLDFQVAFCDADWDGRLDRYRFTTKAFI